MIEPQRLNRMLHLVLRAGMLISLATMIVGLVWSVMSPGHATDVIPFEKLLDELSGGNPIALIEIGILVLIATPFIRLLTALTVFAYEKNIKFVIVSLLVISVVLLAITIKL